MKPIVLFILALLAISTTSARANGEPDVVEQEILRLINVERTGRGLHPLMWRQTLGVAAQQYAETMAAQHSTYMYLNGTTPKQRLLAAGYRPWVFIEDRFAGGQYPENMPEGAVAALLRDPRQRVPLLSPSLFDIGIGVRFGTDFTAYYCLEVAAIGVPID